MIKINNLSQNFIINKKEKEVLKDINFELVPGNIYALLGRNGVGKTTLMKLIARKRKIQSGSIEYGEILKNDTLNICCHFDPIEMSNYMSSNQNVNKITKTYSTFLPNFDKEYVLELYKKFGIDLKRKMKSLSDAQKSLVTTLIVLASNQTMLVFDEPVQLLGADLRELFYKELLNVTMNGDKIVLLSTHIINEIQNIASNVLIIKDSELIINEECDSLKEKNNNISLEEIFMKVLEV